MNYDWTDKRVETAKKLFNGGYSASEIARELGGLTRNAVIGKLTRLGYTRGGQGSGWNKKPPKYARAKPSRYTPFRHVETPANPVTLMQLEQHHCRWPCGDPQSPDFRFCGATRIADGPYCSPHHLLAHNQPPRATTLSQEERAWRARQSRMGASV